MSYCHHWLEKLSNLLESWSLDLKSEMLDMHLVAFFQKTLWESGLYESVTKLTLPVLGKNVKNHFGYLFKSVRYGDKAVKQCISIKYMNHAFL